MLMPFVRRLRGLSWMRQDMETLACIVSWLADGESLGVKLARHIDCTGDSTCGGEEEKVIGVAWI